MNFFQRIQHIGKAIGVYLHPITNSTNIQAYGYKGTTLYILFKGDLLYTYPDTTPEEFKSLSMSSSKGIWVNKNLVKTNRAFHKSTIQI